MRKKDAPCDRAISSSEPLSHFGFKILDFRLRQSEIGNLAYHSSLATCHCFCDLVIWNMRFEICGFRGQQIDSSSHLTLPITDAGRCVRLGVWLSALPVLAPSDIPRALSS